MAKLVEILARELKEWPEGVTAIEQSHYGLTLYERRGPSLAIHVSEIAEDSEKGVVTRAEWQAAVDALKAKDIASSTAAMIDAGWIDPKTPVSPSLHAQVVGRANRIPEWDGDGLPPVGHTCERRFTEVDGSSWMGCIILAHGVKKIFIRDNAGDEFAHSLDEVEFRMFRTPEQIAAEEREKFIDELIKVTCIRRGEAGLIYDAGYRKQEPK